MNTVKQTTPFGSIVFRSVHPIIGVAGMNLDILVRAIRFGRRIILRLGGESMMTCVQKFRNLLIKGINVNLHPADKI